MKKQTKRILSLLLAMTMALGLSACGKSGSQSEVSSTADGERPTVTVGVRTVSSVTTYEDNKLTKYLEDKLNINIDFVNFSTSAGEGITQLNTMIDGGCGTHGLDMPEDLNIVHHYTIIPAEN